MTPRHLRARERVSLDVLALRLGLPVADLRTLEGTPPRLWELGTLAQYLTALGYRLRVTAVRVDSQETELQL